MNPGPGVRSHRHPTRGAQQVVTRPLVTYLSVPRQAWASQDRLHSASRMLAVLQDHMQPPGVIVGV